MADNTIDNLSINITTQSTDVTQAINKLINGLNKLQNQLNQFNKAASNFSKSGNQATTSLLNLGRAGTSVSSIFKGIGNSFGIIGSKAKTLIGGISNVSRGFIFSGNSADNAGRRYASLASKIGLLYAKFFLLIRIFRIFKGAIDIASDLTEVQNVVDVTFGKMSGKMENFAKTSIKSFGMSELSAKTFASRFQAMGNAMGITGSQVAEAQKKISQFKLPDGTAAGYDKASNSMADMSLNLTKLTADMASFYNVNQEDVAKALQSGVMAGQTRPLRTYGLDLTEATLAEWAMKNGLDANIKSMTQAQKTMLRYQFVMANATASQKDFQRTSNTWHNQIVILKQQIQQLGAVIGMGLIQMIKPVVATINNALSGIIEFSKKVVNALGKIFGWQLEMSTSGMSLDDSDIDTSGLEDVVDNADGASDSLDKATKSAKKFKDQLQGFDKLNVLRTTQTDSDSPSSSNGGKGSGDTGKGTGVGTVNQGDVKSALKKTKSMFESDIDDLYGLGKYIGETLRKALAGIDWNRVYQGARNFGKGLAEFLNGLISPELFSAIGKTIAGCLNTAFHFLDSFGQTFDWSNFGKSIGVGLTTFLNTLDWNTALSAAYNWGRGVALALNNFLASTSFDAIGRTIANSINLAVANALAFGKTFNFSLLGVKLASAVNSALSNINWSDIASAVHEWATGLARTINAFLWKTDFTQIGSTLAHVLGEAIRFAFDFGNTINFAELGQKLADAVNGFIATFPAGKFADTIDVWVQGLYDLVVEFFKNLDWNGLKDKIKEFFGRLDWKTIEILLSGLAIIKAGGFAITIGSAIISAIATQFTKQIATVITAKMASSPLLAGAIGKGLGDAAKSGANGSYLGTAGASLGKSLFGTFMVGGGTYIAVQSFLEMWKNGWHIAGELFKDFGIAVAMGGAVVLGVLSGPFAIAIGAGIAAVSTLAIVVHDNWDKIAGTIKQKVEETGENLEKMKSDAGRVGSDLKEAWNGLVTDASTAWGELSKGAGETFETVRGTISEKWGAIKKWWTTNSTLEKIKTTVENFKDKVKTKWGETISFWNGKNPLKQVKTTYENIKGKIATKWNETQSYWRGKNPLAQVKTTYENFKEKVSTGWTQVQQFWNGKPTLKDVQVKVASIVEKVQSAWQAAKNWVASHFDLGKLKLGLKYPSIKVDVSWKNIAGVSIPVPSVSWKWKSFAKGGFLDQFNSFTMATLGEDGVPEILGQVGGRPAVAGGAEITGIRDSVESTGYEQISLLRRQNQILMQILNKEFGISEDTVFNAVRRKASDYTMRTGRGAFEY